MGVASGQCDSITVHKVTRRTEYWGVVYRRAAAISDLPAGCQKNGHGVEGEPERGSLDGVPLATILDAAPTAPSCTDHPQPRRSEGRESFLNSRRGSYVSYLFERESRQREVKSQLGRQDTKTADASQGGGCMVIDCGIFDLATGYESLIQVMPPGL
eukprot:gene22958-30143_t